MLRVAVRDEELGEPKRLTFPSPGKSSQWQSQRKSGDTDLERMPLCPHWLQSQHPCALTQKELETVFC